MQLSLEPFFPSSTRDAYALYWTHGTVLVYIGSNGLDGGITLSSARCPLLYNSSQIFAVTR